MSTIRTARPKDDLPQLVAGEHDLSMAVAYVTQDGLASIKERLLGLLENGRTIRILMDLESGNTDPSAVWDILSMATAHPRLQVKTIVSSAHTGILHSKLYIAAGTTTVTFVTGSANLTEAALERNREHAIWIEGSAEEREIQEARVVFEEFWTDPQAKRIDEEAARLYEAYCGRLRRSQARSERRAQSAYTALVDHLLVDREPIFAWPSPDAAYVLGVIAARGRIHVDEAIIDIKLAFRPSSYAGGRISVAGTSFDAAEVLPTIPLTIGQRVHTIIPDAEVSIMNKTIHVDFGSCPDALQVIGDAYAPHTTVDTFRLPKGLNQSPDETVVEFLKGFSVASALLTDHTSMPGGKGKMMVWIRPRTSNERMFNLLANLIESRMGFVVYKHWRKYREPHLKIHCENFQQIGFGIPWWDELVSAGAEYNFNLFPQVPLGALSPVPNDPEDLGSNTRP